MAISPLEGSFTMPENEEPQVESEPQATEAAPEAKPDPWDDPAAARKEIEKLRKESAGYRTKAKELEPLAAKARELEDAQKSEAERLGERLSAAEERAAAATRKAVAARVEALAARAFADPEDAAGALDLAAYADDDGAIDSDAIRRDLDDLLKRKPHWALVDDAGPRSPRPDRTQGSSGNGNRAPQSPEDEFAGWMTRALGGS
ncbi:hypothetical protein ACIQXD_05150 [Streptomyces uncialis]|uniref:hypothetical protein n=1 Tax=Streptomyces uncialis TaxID=1048205 RepID=UPI00382A648D